VTHAARAILLLTFLVICARLDRRAHRLEERTEESIETARADIVRHLEWHTSRGSDGVSG